MNSCLVLSRLCGTSIVRAAAYAFRVCCTCLPFLRGSAYCTAQQPRSWCSGLWGLLVVIPAFVRYGGGCTRTAGNALGQQSRGGGAASRACLRLYRTATARREQEEREAMRKVGRACGWAPCADGGTSGGYRSAGGRTSSLSRGCIAPGSDRVPGNRMLAAHWAFWQPDHTPGPRL